RVYTRERPAQTEEGTMAADVERIDVSNARTETVAFAFGAQSILDRHHEVIEEENVRAKCVRQPQHVDWLRLPAWIFLRFYDETADAACSCISVRLRKQHTDVGLVCDRCEHLLTVDAIDVAIAPRI